MVLVLLVAGGLVVASVAKLRAVQERVECQNNLKSLGIAVANYQSADGRFPPAAMPTPAGLAPQDRLGWLVVLLPYIEAAPYYRQLDHQKGWLDPKNTFLARFPYPPVLCPRQEDQSPDLVPTAYVGIAGLGDDALSLPAKSDRAGFFGYDRVLKAADVKQGTSELLMVVETAQLRGAWTAAGPPTARGVEPGAETYIGASAPFGGLHRGGANALYADGSVRFLSDSTDPEVFRQAAVVRRP
jgi:prepilin-type processing-associated H-X9-DG protein